ncbi:ABC transporter ATP-binding protein [Haloarcula argentinensis]|jgi:iron complex transport system ATP-binding protein|uniref:Cobalamin import ATP-binding protein BtuD n=1 Tax=Haloarcula argentinensis TaxID=43776 RepID=A0A847UKB0_HALAR|nr:ABC transporter ATP-binding protein [Haloarcula argentinensis]NLV14019.1 ATP-binding cassette domain-containing protein [Haloarcula argentinensis]
MSDKNTPLSDAGSAVGVERPSLLKNGQDESVDGSTDSASEFIGEELVISYPSSDEPVIDGESIRVEPGEVTALVGPNGSGKSTMLKGLANQLKVDSGSVLLDGNNIHSLEKKELAQNLGLLSQENVSPNSISVEDLVGHGRYPHRGFFESMTEEDQAAIDEAISLAGIENLRDRELGSLSGGQKQLVWIAMVLAQETNVLLLDEPTTFLDLHHQLEVMEIVETLRDESDITVVLVLHDISQAARYADRMIALKDGSIYARGTPDEILTEELLADVFEIKADVAPSRHGPQITPLQPINESN